MARDIANELGGPDHVHAAAAKPAGVRELSLRSVLCGLAVAAVMGASYPYIVLKLGFGPNVSVVAAFFGYLALGIVFKDYNRWENNIVQPDGTAAGARLDARALAIGAIACAAVMLMTEDARVLAWFPSITLAGTAVMMTTGVGLNWSLLSLGSGMLVGLRINVSMLLGMVISWIIAP